jgi:putative spermidine/putrescine transport system ATP-binding protein
MTARALSLRSVTKSYDGLRKAVDQVSLDIAPGEFVSFLGPSGSGKTTTLMMIAGFEQATSGEIRVDGRAIERVPPHERNIGMVFQNYALFPHMTVADNIGFSLRMRRIAKAEAARRVARALELVHLEAFAGRYPSELSGGQQQRVALARALVFEPDVVLLDEPLGALDKNLREAMQIELKRMHRELGVTMIYVTHDQSEAMAMSDRIAVFQGGRIDHAGSPEEVYFRPKTAFVAGFVGDSNIVEGTVAKPGAVDVPGLGQLAVARHDLPAGRAVHLLMRPELADLSPAAGLDFRVDTVVHYGDSVLALGHSGERPLRIRLPSRAARGIAQGENHRIAWAPADIHVIA